MSTLDDLLIEQKHLSPPAITDAELLEISRSALEQLDSSVANRMILAYMSGSFAERLANASSDIDVFVVVDESSYTRRRPLTINSPSGSLPIRVDIEVWESGRVDAVVDRLRRSRPGEDRLVGAFDGAEERFLHRAFAGVPLIGGVDRLERLREYINFNLFCRYLVVKNVAITHEIAEDLWGCLESKDLVSLIGRCRNLVEHGFDSFAASLGLTNPSPKWRGRKLLNLIHLCKFPPNISEYLVELLLGFSYAERVIADPEFFAHTSFDVCNRLIYAAERNGSFE